ncbi:uncharacterized protein LOC142351559 [Convolutriloba macropyga]|uniref:uncharacterized protein LOC142351559 n=1 Tax=Convolutriloba macropyga TaxID=536237 RepID=UPI003F523BEA
MSNKKANQKRECDTAKLVEKYMCHDFLSETTSCAGSSAGNTSTDNNRAKGSECCEGTRCSCKCIEQKPLSKLDCCCSGALAAVAYCVVNCQGKDGRREQKPLSDYHTFVNPPVYNYNPYADPSLPPMVEYHIGCP